MAETMRELVERWWAAFNGARETGIEPLLDLCHPEIEMTNPPQFPVRDHYVGHEGIRQWFDDSWDVIDEVRMEVDDVIETSDESFVMMLRLRGNAAHTRIPIDETWAAVCSLRDGQLYRAQGYVSRREALRAAGLRE